MQEAQVVEFVRVAPWAANILVLLWALTCELGWFPLWLVLHAYQHRRWAVAVLIGGIVGALFMFFPVLVLATHADVYDQNRIEKEIASIIWYFVLSLGIGVLPSAVVGVLHRKFLPHKHLLLATVLATDLAIAWAMPFAYIVKSILH